MLSSFGNPAGRYTAAFIAGAVSGAAAVVAVYKLRQPEAPPHHEHGSIDPSTMARFEKKIQKLQRSSQERVHWKAVDKEMLGLQPRLWMEVLDEKHRYATLLYDYWRRWQLSDTREYFFSWLDYGAGSMIDLPHSPRRLLDEWRVIYLVRELQPHFLVEIDPSTGRFLWKADGTPVTLPLEPWPGGKPPPSATYREKKANETVYGALERSFHRDKLLTKAREEVERHKREGAKPTRELLERLAKPLVKEGLLCQLRDPYFQDRLDASPIQGGHAHLGLLERLPSELNKNVSWDDFLHAIDHDEGRMMKTPFPRGEERLKGKGIFVLDTFGCLYCSTKIRGVLHHSSFVRGHCVKVAGGLKIEDGWLVELSPHSGHYQPGQDHIDEMMADWKAKGVDFEKVILMPYAKR